VDPESLLQIRILPFPVIPNLELDPDITLTPRQEKKTQISRNIKVLQQDF
jgi:hypothetical protein